ncbi:MAG: hypothetical protein ICV63_19065, partial [Coleofasciculus sp. Co-bin14]|nr:hypothetical protein [Coleofasciculus sp. Co-bin14]
MTQLSPKPGFNNNSNGRAAYPTNAPLDSRMSATNYPSSPPHPGQFYQGQQATQWLPQETIKPIAQIQGDRRQRRFGLRWLNANLRAKTLVVAIAIGTLPVLGIGAFAYFSTAQGVEKQNFSSLLSNGQDLSDKLASFLDERNNDIRVLADLAIFTNPKLRNQLSRQEKDVILSRYQKTYGFYD